MDKVIDIEERIPTLRDRRKKRTNRKFAGLLIILLLLFVVLIYSQSPISKIQRITVTGGNLVEEAYYINASGLKKGDSMWSFEESPVEKKLGDLHWVKSVSVEKNWLTTVEFQVEEFEKVGYVDSGNGYQVLLSNGYAGDMQTGDLDGPLLSGFEDEEKVARLAEQLSQLDPEVYRLVSEIIQSAEEENPDLVTLYMNDGNEVHAAVATLAEKMNYYPSIISQIEDGQRGIIDVEVGIFFRSYEDTYGTQGEDGTDEQAEPPAE